MSLTAAAVRMMADKGLSGEDIADIAEANEPGRSTAATRQKRYRDNKKRNERDVTRDVTPPSNEETSNSPVSLSAEADCLPLAEKVVASWNDMASLAGLPASRTLNPKRKSALRARIAEHGEDAVFEAIRHVGESPFHRGENDRGWKADLGWLLTSPEKFQKMLEYQPDIRAQATGSPSPLSTLITQSQRYRPKAQAA